MILSTPIFRTGLAVATGGIVGATVRWGAQELIGSGTLPWSTLTVNIVGCVILGWVGQALLSGAAINRYLLVALGTGFCGSLTTFSSFSVEVAQFLRGDAWGKFTFYVAISLVLGISGVFAGRRLFAVTGPGQSIPQIGQRQ